MQGTSLKSLKKRILIGHSPDADDAFMFYALAKGIIKSKVFDFEHVLKDIQTLNKESSDLKYDVQAISFFAYPDVFDKYQLLPCGGSVGYGYGPVLVGRELEDRKFEIGGWKLERKRTQENKKIVIAIPGEKTTAFLLLKLLLKDFKYKVVPFDQILDSVKCGESDFGLIIHEGQLSYLKHKLTKVLDLGEWWLGKTNLPLPLGCNVVRRSLNEEEKKEINSLIKKSIAYSLQNKEKVLTSVSKYARELESNNNLVNKFVSMYVNEFTLDYGVMGIVGIKKLYQMAFQSGLINKMPTLDFVV